ncbi:MAG TPA: ATP-binding protein [Exilispira sp.]|nr:ATP-binding protein [Exilispira sp.]
MKDKDIQQIELLKTMGRAIIDYNMIEEGETVLVCLSGGKDSITLIDLLYKNQMIRIFPKSYNLVAFHITLTKEDTNYKILGDYCRERNIPFYFKLSDLTPFIEKKENHRKNECYICSQIRRKWILDQAEALNIKKIAFGHTLDDIVTTSLMNIFFNRTLASEVPKLSILEDKFCLIRPLAYLSEDRIQSYVKKHNLPVFKSRCTIGDDGRRKKTQKLIDSLLFEFPDIKENIFAAFRNPSNKFLLNNSFNPPDHKGKKYRP